MWRSEKHRQDIGVDKSKNDTMSEARKMLSLMLVVTGYYMLVTMTRGIYYLGEKSCTENVSDRIIMTIFDMHNTLVQTLNKCTFVAAIPRIFPGEEHMGRAPNNIFWTTMSILSSANHAVNCVIYVCCGRTFRAELCSLFKRRADRYRSTSAITRESNMSISSVNTNRHDQEEGTEM